MPAWAQDTLGRRVKNRNRGIQEHTDKKKISLGKASLKKVANRHKITPKIPKKFDSPNTCTACRPAGSNGAGAGAQVEAAGCGVGEADPGLGKAWRRAPGSNWGGQGYPLIKRGII